MQRLQHLWIAFRNFAIIFSFIVNLVLVITLLIVAYLLFDIKNSIAEPLIDGLHSNFVAMDEATIYRTIPVEAEIPVNFDLLVQDNITVVLTQPVPLTANATFLLPGGGGSINGTVNLNLPAGMQLPIALVLNVPVREHIPVSLDVSVAIPLSETELHGPFVGLRQLLDPYVYGLDQLPDSWPEAFTMLTGYLPPGATPPPMPPMPQQAPSPTFDWTAATPGAQ